MATDVLDGVATQSESVAVTSAPAITSAGFGAGEVGVAYDAMPSATGGTAPYTWSVTRGSLPAGLSIDPATGEVTGTPRTSRTSTFTLVATDAEGQHGHPVRVDRRRRRPAITSAALAAASRRAPTCHTPGDRRHRRPSPGR